MTEPRIDELLEPSYLEGLSELPLEEVRARRAVCTEEEVNLSYLRRMVQGRLDLVLAEGQRRQAGGSGGGATSMVERLASILSDKVHAPGFGRLPTIMAPSELGREATGEVDAVAPPDRIGHLNDVPDDELNAMIAGLQRIETDVSAQRRRLHDVLDRLQEEVIRRYQSGEADVDSLLR